MEFREFSAKTVDEAITKASIEFETSSENLEIQVISQGKAGFLGFGAKPAIIRAGKKEEEEILPEDVKEAKEPAKKSAPARKEEKKEQKRDHKKEQRKEPKRENTVKVQDVPAEKEEKPREERKVLLRTEEEIAEIKDEAVKFLSGVFKAMGLQVEIYKR